MSNRQPLPPQWVERIWERFALVYGHTRTAPMFDGADIAEVKAFWAHQLSGFSGATIGAALRALVDRADSWPPTLPEFVQLCRQFNRPEHAQSAMLPAPPVSEESRSAASAALEAISIPDESDYLFWARRPKSAKAVELLQIGAQTDSRLRGILSGLIADPSPARSDEARQALEALRAVA